jgi:ribonuclease HI
VATSPTAPRLTAAWRRLRQALWPRRALSLYCDGSAAERVGRPGGWAFVVVRDDEVLVSKSGAAAATTCLVMELEAARAGLAEVVARGWHHDAQVELVSDSTIALDIAAGRYLPRKHVALAQSLREVAVQAGVHTRWVRAHSGQKWNEAVDALAHQARMGGG